MDPVQVLAGADPQNPLRVIVRIRHPAKGQPDFDARSLLNCQGRKDRMVMFTSQENQEFFIKRAHALQSSTIRAMLEAPRYPQCDCTEMVRFPTINSRLMLHVCKLLVFKATFAGRGEVAVPPYTVEPEVAAEFDEVAKYLNIL